MENENFVHLHLHDQYSTLDGYGSAKQYITRAKEIGFKYIALTNHGNIDGLIKFQKECDKQEIKPVLGCELYIVPRISVKPAYEKKGHITILIKNIQGWEVLCRILSKANMYSPK